MNDLVTFTVVLAIGIFLTYLYSKALKLNVQPIPIAEKKREATLGLLVFAAVFVVTFGVYAFYNSVWVRTTLTADPIYVLRDAIWIGAILAPAVAAMKWTKQGFGSVGISRRNLSKNIILAFVMSVTFIAIIGLMASLVGGSFGALSPATLFALLSSIIIGFGEELVFRGYIQTRLTAQSGAIFGIAATAVLFAFSQFPVGYYCFLDVPLGLFYAAWRLSTGLLFGYMFHRSQSIFPSTIFHGLIVWWALQWALYF